MKYRIWDKVNKCYLPLYDHILSNQKKYFVVYDEVFEVCKGILGETIIFQMANRENYIIEQSTGIYDINSVELFENDKVIGNVINGNIQIIGYIKYNKKIRGYKFTYEGVGERKLSSITKIKKIGTIHDV